MGQATAKYGIVFWCPLIIHHMLTPLSTDEVGRRLLGATSTSHGKGTPLLGEFTGCLPPGVGWQACAVHWTSGIAACTVNSSLSMSPRLYHLPPYSADQALTMSVT